MVVVPDVAVKRLTSHVLNSVVVTVRIRVILLSHLNVFRHFLTIATM